MVYVGVYMCASMVKVPSLCFILCICMYSCLHKHTYIPTCLCLKTHLFNCTGIGHMYTGMHAGICTLCYGHTEDA